MASGPRPGPLVAPWWLLGLVFWVLWFIGCFWVVVWSGVVFWVCGGGFVWGVVGVWFLVLLLGGGGLVWCCRFVLGLCGCLEAVLVVLVSFEGVVGFRFFGYWPYM